MYIVILFLMSILDCGKFSAELDIQLQVIWMPFQAPELACSKVLRVAAASFLMRGSQQQVTQTKLHVTHNSGFLRQHSEVSSASFNRGRDEDPLIESPLVLQTD